MLTAYIQAALDHAVYKILPDDEGYWGEAPDLPGAWGHGETLAECQRELQAAVEGWMVMAVRFGDPMPIVPSR